MWHPLRDQVRQQHAFIDHINQLCLGEFRAKGGTIHCAKGCSGCCNLNVHCALAEVLPIAEQLDQAMFDALDHHAEHLEALALECDDLKTFLRACRQQLGPCPLLDAGGSCTIYPLRPLSCRALQSTQPAHYCRLDFSTLSSADKQAFMAGLDRESVNFPTHYLAVPQQVAMAAEQQLTDSTCQQFGFGLSGNLPYLLHLEHRHQLSQQLIQGEEAVKQLLPEPLWNKPFLFQLTRQP